MTVKLPDVIHDFVKAGNACDRDAFKASFAEDALVNDVERDFWGIDEIMRWADAEVLVPSDNLTLEIAEAKEHYGDYIVKLKVDGNFDKTNLPDPLYITQHITIRDDKIVKFISIQVKESNMSLEDALKANAGSTT